MSEATPLYLSPPQSTPDRSESPPYKPRSPDPYSLNQYRSATTKRRLLLRKAHRHSSEDKHSVLYPKDSVSAALREILRLHPGNLRFHLPEDKNLRGDLRPSIDADQTSASSSLPSLGILTDRRYSSRSWRREPLRRSRESFPGSLPSTLKSQDRNPSPATSFSALATLSLPRYRSSRFSFQALPLGLSSLGGKFNFLDAKSLLIGNPGANDSLALYKTPAIITLRKASKGQSPRQTNDGHIDGEVANISDNFCTQKKLVRSLLARTLSILPMEEDPASAFPDDADILEDQTSALTGRSKDRRQSRILKQSIRSSSLVTTTHGHGLVVDPKLTRTDLYILPKPINEGDENSILSRAATNASHREFEVFLQISGSVHEVIWKGGTTRNSTSSVRNSAMKDDHDDLPEVEPVFPSGSKDIQNSTTASSPFARSAPRFEYGDLLKWTWDQRRHDDEMPEQIHSPLAAQWLAEEHVRKPITSKQMKRIQSLRAKLRGRGKSGPGERNIESFPPLLSRRGTAEWRCLQPVDIYQQSPEMIPSDRGQDQASKGDRKSQYHQHDCEPSLRYKQEDSFATGVLQGQVRRAYSSVSDLPKILSKQASRFRVSFSAASLRQVKEGNVDEDGSSGMDSVSRLSASSRENLLPFSRGTLQDARKGSRMKSLYSPVESRISRLSVASASRSRQNGLK